MTVWSRARWKATMSGAVFMSTLVAFVGCGNPTDIQRSEFGAAYFGTPDFPLSLVRIRIDEGTSRHDLDADDFILQPSAAPRTQLVPVWGTGVLPVRISMVTAEEDTLASGLISFTLQPGYLYSVGIHSDTDRPMPGCNSTVLALPLRREGNAEALEGDTLFLSYGFRAPDPTC